MHIETISKEKTQRTGARGQLSGSPRDRAQLYFGVTLRVLVLMVLKATLTANNAERGERRQQQRKFNDKGQDYPRFTLLLEASFRNAANSAPEAVRAPGICRLQPDVKDN